MGTKQTLSDLFGDFLYIWVCRKAVSVTAQGSQGKAISADVTQLKKYPICFEH